MGYRVIVTPKIGVKFGYITVPVELEVSEAEELRLCEDIATDIITYVENCDVTIEEYETRRNSVGGTDSPKN